MFSRAVGPQICKEVTTRKPTRELLCMFCTLSINDTIMKILTRTVDIGLFNELLPLHMGKQFQLVSVNAICAYLGPDTSPAMPQFHSFTVCDTTSCFKVACSRLRDSGEKSFSKKKCDPFPKSRASYFRFACFNTSALYYLRAWHRLASRARERNPFEKLGGRIVKLQMCSFIFPINHITTWTRRRISEFLLIIFLLRAAFGCSGVGMWRLKEKDLGYLKEQDLNRF